MIHPVRLKGTPANIARYYTVGDYYTKGGDEHSEWGGAIARDLGRTGKVDKATFKALMSGQVDGQQLGRRRREGGIEHHPGWDFAVNAPKSVSIMALVAGDARILAAHERAVGTALDYLEEHAQLRRREEGEVVHHTTGRLIFARFTEHASRELDPHLHTHVVVMNMTSLTPDETMSSLETRAMFAEQMTAGQIYRSDLAHRLKELGYEVDFHPRTGLFEVRGVPADLIRHFSQRAEQIDAHAADHGHVGQERRRQSFYATRPKKEKVSMDGLRDSWAKRSRVHTETLVSIRTGADLIGERDLPPDPMTSARAMLFGIRQSETSEAVNNLGRMFRVALASDVGTVRLSDIRPLSEEHEVRRKLLSTREQTGDQILVKGRSSRATARLELSLSQHLAMALDDSRPIASADRLLTMLDGTGLNSDQQQALVQVATSRDRLQGIHGVAGSGKSTLVKELVAAGGSGITAIALAPTSSAAAELGAKAGIESRTVASLLAGGGYGISERHLLVLDEAGQLGNRQATRVLEISRRTGARVLFLGDNKQTGAIEQGKAFWLLQRLGLPTAQLTEAVRQETRSMKAAVAHARSGDYAASLAALDSVVVGDTAAELAKGLVSTWTRLSPKSRAGTNILVLENATRLIVNSRIREVLKQEGAVAAEETRLSVLTPAGLSSEEKHVARFYSGGQVVTFSRDNTGIGIARDTEYRVAGLARAGNGRQVVRLVDENGRTILWDPRLGAARQVNVFNREQRSLSAGDRIQWRLANRELELKNAERGTIEGLQGSIATVRWDRENRVTSIDLEKHKTWDHGYAETVYSAQSKTYDRVYVLAPVGSGLVNGQNYYTAITRARLGAKLWTESARGLAEKLSAHSGEQTSALEGLGRLSRDHRDAFAKRHPLALREARVEQERQRREQRDRTMSRERSGIQQHSSRFDSLLADRALGIARHLDRILQAAFALSRRSDQTLDPSRQAAEAERLPREDGLMPRGPERHRGVER